MQTYRCFVIKYGLFCRGLFQKPRLYYFNSAVAIIWYYRSMRKIAVLIQNMEGDYAQEALRGVLNYCGLKGVCCTVIQAKRPDEGSGGMVEDQYWASLKLVGSEDIEGVIILAGEFTSQLATEDLVEKLGFLKKKPVVCVSTDIPFPFEHSYTFSICNNAYDEVVSHMYNEHGARKFAFFSAALTKSVEGVARFEAFRNALSKVGIDPDSATYIDGDFTYRNGKRLLMKRFKSKADVDFDVLFAANDRMALAARDVFISYGLKVPQDVKIVGYDDDDATKASIPTITTINQQIAKHGEEAAKALLARLEGEPLPKVIEVDVKPMYRQSCGCVSTSVNKTLHYENGKLTEVMDRALNVIKDAYEANRNLMKIYHIISYSQVAKSFESVLASLDGMFFAMADVISEMSVILYDKKVPARDPDKFDVPRRARRTVFINLDENVKDLTNTLTITPLKQLLPEEKNASDQPGEYLVHPIFFETNQYGYIIVRMKSRDYILALIVLKTLANVLARALDYSEAMSENNRLFNKNRELSSERSILSKQSKTDELTKILNRRGFLDYGQRSIDLSIQMGKTGMVFFGDMNGLKKINDTYGHKMGDEAIKAQAEIFKRTFRSSDIIGRMSGDEFAIVAVGALDNQLEFFRKKIAENCRSVSEERGFPFTISIALGAVPFNEQDSELESLLDRADEVQYSEKKRLHLERGD